MLRLLDVFFEYVAVRKQRERVISWIGIIAMAMGMSFAVAGILYRLLH